MRDAADVDNVYMIDTMMFGYERFNSAYLVKGKELALIDTGPASSKEVVQAGINAHGYSVSDISYIFVTHEHNDHSGNVGKLLKENTKAKVYASPIDSEHLTDPAQKRAWMKSINVYQRPGGAQPG